MEEKNNQIVELSADHKEYNVSDLFARAMADESWETDEKVREEVGGLWWFTLGAML